MLRNIFNIFGMVSLLVVTLFFGGCASTRGEINLNSQKNQVANPVSNQKIFIRSVLDNRHFEVAPHKASTPSLKYPKDINNTKITSHAIARKRNGFGHAMGDILLPQNVTVADIIKKTVADTLKEQGYQIVQSADDATSIVDVKINKFWCWITPGFWSISLESEFQIVLQSQKDKVFISNPATANGYVHLHTQMALDNKFQYTIEKGLLTLKKDIAKQIIPIN